MSEIQVNEISDELPTWDLTEIYEDINDPKINKDISEIRDTVDQFLKKWKGKINNLSSTDFLSCINKYQ